MSVKKKAAKGHNKPAKAKAKSSSPVKKKKPPVAKPKKPAKPAKPEKPVKAAKPEKPAKSVKAPAPAHPQREKVGVSKGAGSAQSPKRPQRKSLLAQRRGPNGEPFVPGDLLLPHGPQGEDEMLYFFRGCLASGETVGELGITEALTKRGQLEDKNAQEDVRRCLTLMRQRFLTAIEPALPSRSTARRTWPGIVERAKARRREIGAFLRGLDFGGTESSHMDAHGEASLHDLMKWGARLENLAEADEPEQADFAQFHRGLDQLDSTTEALIIDVELTLKRLRDRVR
jgi:hypothetical protein